MSSSVSIKIEGEGVLPNTVLLSDLLRILTEVNNAISVGKYSSKKPVKKPRISLVKIESGSNCLHFTTNAAGERRFTNIAKAVYSDKPRNIPAKAQKSLHALHDRARKNHWKIEIIAPGARATIDPEKPLFNQREFKEQTSILAYIVRVGGEGKPTATVRLPSEHQITVTLSSLEIAKELGDLLYQWVDLEGYAIWGAKDWKLNKFFVTQLGPYRSGAAKPTKSLDELTRLSGGFWDKVDPDKYIRELRCGE